MTPQLWLWVGFTLFVLAMLALDLGVFHRKAHTVSFKDIFLVVFLVFTFVAREAWPLLQGRMNSALVQPVIPPDEMDKQPPEKIREYLGLTKKQSAEMDQETLRTLMDIKIEAQDEIPAQFRNDPDARLNTTEWREMIFPRQWTGYDKPEYIWQPVGQIHKYNLIPLIVGSLKTTPVGLLFSVPLAVAAAIYVSQLARPRVRELVKPAIEMLSGIPSVVVGFFALLVMATVLPAVLAGRLAKR